MYPTVYCRDDHVGHTSLTSASRPERMGGERLHEAELAGPRDRLEAALYAELAQDAVDVALDRADGDDQLLRDRLVGVAGRQEAQHLQFALGEHFRKVAHHGRSVRGFR